MVCPGPRPDYVMRLKIFISVLKNAFRPEKFAFSEQKSFSL